MCHLGVNTWDVSIIVAITNEIHVKSRIPTHRCKVPEELGGFKVNSQQRQGQLSFPHLHHQKGKIYDPLWQELLFIFIQPIPWKHTTIISCPSFAQETCQISAIWNFARVLLIALFHILFHHLSFGNFWLWIQFYHQVGCHARHRRHCVLTNKAQTKWTNQNIQHANDKTTKVWTIWSMNCLWKVPNLCWISLWRCHIVAKWCQNDM